MTKLNKVGDKATSVKVENGTLTVRYHDTDVVKANLNGQVVVLDNGGWLTATTRNRMAQASNQFGLGFNVSFADGKMTVWGKDWRFETNDTRVVFNRVTGVHVDMDQADA